MRKVSSQSAARTGHSARSNARKLHEGASEEGDINEPPGEAPVLRGAVEATLSEEMPNWERAPGQAILRVCPGLTSSSSREPPASWSASFSTGASIRVRFQLLGLVGFKTNFCKPSYSVFISKAKAIFGPILQRVVSLTKENSSVQLEITTYTRSQSQAFVINNSQLEAGSPS